METLMVWCVLVLLPYCTFGYRAEYGLPSQDETIERLNKIEAVLETVLEKNNQLERKNADLDRRVEALEEENRRLNALVSKQEEQDTPSENADGDSSPALPSGTTHGLNLRKRANRAPRLLLSADNTVAFTAYIAVPDITGLGVGQTVVYENAITNVGGAYHNKTGVFTAPVSGVYVFNVDTMLNPDQRQYLELVVDGNHILHSYTHGTGEPHYMTTSRTVTLRVGAGSEVWIRTLNSVGHGDGNLHGNGFSSFSGWLLAFTE